MRGLGAQRILFRRWASIDYLLKTLPAEKHTVHPKNKAPAPRKPNNLPPHDLTRILITPQELTARFWPPEYRLPSRTQLAESSGVFLHAQVKLEWTLASYDEIPDIKYQRLKAESAAREDLNDTRLAEAPRKRTSFGINPKLLQPLPEVLLLGHTNVGKSSLVNHLLGEKNMAFVSRQPGYTRTMNCYNVGDRFRLVDSPGYGARGEEKQGQMVLEYLEKRRILRQVYVLVDSVQGIVAEDGPILDHLIDSGIPFDIVFTKVDKVIDRHMSHIPSNVKLAIKKQTVLPPDARMAYAESIRDTNAKIERYFGKMIHDAHLDQLASLPRIYFNNAYKSAYVRRCHGYQELRHAMLERL